MCNRSIPTDLILVAGGGTGGHLFPAMSIQRWMEAKHQDVQFRYLCTEKTIDHNILSAANATFQAQPVHPPSSNPVAFARFALGYGRAYWQARTFMRKEQPTVVLGTGGYASAPAVHAAHQLGIPCALLNPDALVGRANRFLARMASTVFVQWPSTLDLLPHNIRNRCVISGCPIRQEFSKEPSRPHERWGLDNSKKTLLVTGASLGSHSLNTAVQKLVPELEKHDDWQILHITGLQDYAAVRDSYAQVNLTTAAVPFTEDMHLALMCADLVIARAGAVTVAEVSACRKPAIFMPYPHHKDRHQYLNAGPLVSAGAAVICDDLPDLEQRATLLKSHLLPMLSNPNVLSRMATSAHKLPSRNASETISKHLLSFCSNAREESPTAV